MLSLQVFAPGSQVELDMTPNRTACYLTNAINVLFTSFLMLTEPRNILFTIGFLSDTKII